MAKKQITIETHIQNRSSLAFTYAEDGAFHSAARVLKDLAEDVARHAANVDQAIQEYLAAQQANDALTITIDLAKA